MNFEALVGQNEARELNIRGIVVDDYKYHARECFPLQELSLSNSKESMTLQRLGQYLRPAALVLPS